MCDYIIRPIKAEDDTKIAKIIRYNLERFHLDIPGTAYFDKELDSLSKYYNALPEKRRYFIVTDYDGCVNCAEIQKLYLSDLAKGRGLGKKLMQTAEEFAAGAGYKRLYLETHSDLKAAIGLYEKLGFHIIDKPEAALHSTMDRVYIKELNYE